MTLSPLRDFHDPFVQNFPNRNSGVLTSPGGVGRGILDRFRTGVPGAHGPGTGARGPRSRPVFLVQGVFLIEPHDLVELVEGQQAVHQGLGRALLPQVGVVALEGQGR